MKNILSHLSHFKGFLKDEAISPPLLVPGVLELSLRLEETAVLCACSGLPSRLIDYLMSGAMSTSE